MRFHKFRTRNDGDLWVDLDRVHAVKVGEYADHAKLATPNGAVEVAMSVEDALALISPPAAPDRYEEDLRTDKQLADAMLRVRARHDAVTPQWVKDALAREDARLKAQSDALLEAQEKIPEAMSSCDHKARLDELDRFEKALKLKFPFSEGSWTDLYVQTRRKEMA